MEVLRGKTKAVQFAIVVPVIVIIIVVVLTAPAIKRQLNDWKLLPQPERLTELYFTDPNSLPGVYTPGQLQTVKFTVHNLEYRTTAYSYVVSEQSQSVGTSHTLATGSFTLTQNQFKNPVLDISPTDLGPNVKVTVDLQGQHESIDYLVSREGA